MAIQLDQTVFADVAVLAVSGRLDGENATEFEEKLQAILSGDGPSQVVLDLNGLDYISSAGLHAVMRVSRHAKTAGGAVSIARPTAFVSEILNISRFDRVIGVHETIEDGLAAFSADAADAFKQNS